MNKFALLSLLGLVGSSAAFSPAVGKAAFSSTSLASTKLIDPALNVAPPMAAAPPAVEDMAVVPAAAVEPEWTGEKSKAPINTYVDARLEPMSLAGERLTNPVSFCQRQRDTVSLDQIRAQQDQHGLFVDGRIDHTRNCMRF